MTATVTLIEEAAKAVHDARAIMADYDGKDMPADVREQLDTLLETARSRKAAADEAKAQDDKRRELDSLSDYFTRPVTRIAHAAASTADSKADRAALERKAMVEFFKSGTVPAEYKALSATTDIEGGFTIPDVFRREIIQKIEDMFHVRNLATVLPPIPGGASINIPAADTELEDATWTTEIATADEDTTQPFGQRTLRPNQIAKLIKVSVVLMRGGEFGIESWIRDELAKKSGRAEEQAFMTGSGVGQPSGIFLSGARGTDFTCANTTSIVADDFIGAKYTLRAQYRRNTAWLMHRTLIRDVSKLKDGDGQYLWQPSLQAGQPDRLLGDPVYESEFAPNTMTTGLYVAAYADFGRAYYIVDSQQFTIQRLNELYAATNQVGFIGRREVDGQIVDGNALVRVKLA